VRHLPVLPPSRRLCGPPYVPPTRPPHEWSRQSNLVLSACHFPPRTSDPLTLLSLPCLATRSYTIILVLRALRLDIAIKAFVASRWVRTPNPSWWTCSERIPSFASRWLELRDCRKQSGKVYCQSSGYGRKDNKLALTSVGFHGTGSKRTVLPKLWTLKARLDQQWLNIIKFSRLPHYDSPQTVSDGKEAKKRFLWTDAIFNGAAQAHGGGGDGGSEYDNVFTENTRKYGDGCGLVPAAASLRQWQSLSVALRKSARLKISIPLAWADLYSTGLGTRCSQRQSSAAFLPIILPPLTYRRAGLKILYPHS